MNKHDEFDLANNAFDLFTLAERERVLEEFASLHYPSVRDRFFEAVHRVIGATKLASSSGGSWRTVEGRGR